MKKLWVIYDGRACGGDIPEEACIFIACDSNEEARSCVENYGDCACYSYKLGPKDTEGRTTLIDPEWEWDWHIENGFNEGS